MPRARRRRYSGRHRAADEPFGHGEVRAPASPAAGIPETGSFFRGAAAETAGRDAEARREYARELLADPDNIPARLALVRLLERLEEPEEAFQVLEEGVARHAEDPELRLARGRALGQMRRYAEAEADLRRVLRLQPSHGAAHFELGLILVRRGRATEAADAFARAVAAGPESAQTYTELAEALNQSGRLSEAAAALERAVALDPALPRAYNLLGRVLDRLERADEAAVMYRRAREIAGQ